mmetsp:Transcript_1248/g.4087  ORF Transcript_1248/g.4087 Transcript_1248/m.4087 type:complete len:202 (+) Transcript_1248:1903-2508(+)
MRLLPPPASRSGGLQRRAAEAAPVRLHPERPRIAARAHAQHHRRLLVLVEHHRGGGRRRRHRHHLRVCLLRRQPVGQRAAEERLQRPQVHLLSLRFLRRHGCRRDGDRRRAAVHRHDADISHRPQRRRRRPPDTHQQVPLRARRQRHRPREQRRGRSRPLRVRRRREVRRPRRQLRAHAGDQVSLRRWRHRARRGGGAVRP